MFDYEDDQLERKRREFEFCDAKLGAENGSAWAQSRLADIYSHGNEFCAKDISKALYWYDEAIKNGWKDAYVSKADIYIFEWHQVREDYNLIKTAIAILTAGTNDYSIGSAIRLGDMYSHIGDYYRKIYAGVTDYEHAVVVDYCEAFRCYSKAIDIYKMPVPDKIHTGHDAIENAIFGLAWLYWHGYGVAKDDIKALLYALVSFKHNKNCIVYYAFLKEMFGSGIAGPISLKLASACEKHDGYQIEQFIHYIEGVRGKLEI